MIVKPEQFAKSDFNALDWLDHVLIGKDLDSTSLQILQDLLLIQQEISHSLDLQSTETVQKLPQLFQSIQQAEEYKNNLIQSLDYQVEDQLGPVYESLLHIQTMRRNMEKAKSALKEAERWYSLARDMDMLLADGDLDRISLRLQESVRTLNMLKNSPDYDEKLKLLSTYQDKLESMLVPILISSFNDLSVETLRKSWQLFDRMNRNQHFFSVYHHERKREWTQSWSSIVGDDLNQALTLFFDKVLDFMEKEFVWCSQIFKKPVWVMNDMLKQVFGSIGPLFSSRLSHLLRQGKPLAYPIMTKCFLNCSSFVYKAELFLYQKASENPSYFSSPDHWAITLLDPFLALQQHFSEYENGFLSDALNSLTQVEIEMQRMLEEKIVAVFKLGEGSVQRCLQLTLGYGALELLESLSHLFEQFVKAASDSSEHLKNEMVAEIERFVSEQGDQTSGAEWTYFQNGLNMYAGCKVLEESLCQFESAVKKMLETRFKPLLLLTTEQECLESGHSIAAIHLLKTSPLNNTHLHTWMESLENQEKLFPNVHQHVQQWSKELQLFLYTAVCSTIHSTLTVLPTLDIWTHGPGMITSPFNLAIPQFSLSPSVYISRIGERLLTLPQELGLYADEKVFYYSAHDLRHISEQDLIESREDGEMDATHLWVLSVARETMNELVVAVRKTQFVNEHGKKQVETDLRYLSNVLSAMDIEWTMEFELLSKEWNIE